MSANKREHEETCNPVAVFDKGGRVLCWTCKHFEDEWVRYPFVRTHVPTGNRVLLGARFVSREAFESTIDYWNHSAPDWRYEK